MSSSDSSLAQPSTSGTKRSSDDPQSNISSKKPRNDTTYPASGVKRALHGTIYQLQLLMLFMLRGIKNYYDFRLATEMDAAEKFDDVVFQYKKSVQSKWTWVFLQAKHKQSPEKDKITVTDLITSREGDFSLLKYFISFCKIKNNPKFRNDDLEDFIICTNTSFDFELNLNLKSDGKPTKKAQELNALKTKWQGFFKIEDLQDDDILYFAEEAKAKKVRFKSDDETIAAISQEIKSALLKNGLKKEIKDNHIFENNTKDFLRKFRFVISYPNVDDLNYLIGKEIGQDFQLLDADLVTHSFQKDMLDWFKEKTGRFLSPDDRSEFLSSLKEKVETLMTSGLGQAYPQKLRAYGIRFENNLLNSLNTFLSSKEQILHVSTLSTRLSAIKVLERLKRDDKYEYDDSYIFLRLRTLLRAETQKHVIKAFSSDITHDLLVIECQAKTQGDPDELKKKLTTALSKSYKKKIILIAKDEDALATSLRLSHKIKSINDQSCFKDLDSTSQKHLLEDTSVFLQEKALVLDNLISKVSAELIIDQVILTYLIEREEPLIIGNTQAFSSIGYMKDYYIKRTFRQQMIKNKVLEEKADSELFFVTGDRKVVFSKLEKDSIHTWEYEKSYDRGIIWSDSGQNVQEIFQKLCNQQSAAFGTKADDRKNIHWLEYKNGHLTWRASSGKLSGLRHYIDNDFLDENNSLEETYFTRPENLGQKVVILANDPGIGKSTLLTSIARQMKENDAALWVVRVNLNDYAERGMETILEKIDFKENDVDGSIDFVSKMAVPGDSNDPDIQLQRKLFKAGDHKLKIVILFDGFDEISPNYKLNTTKLIKALRGSNLTQLWITTRVHEKTHLEEELESPAFILNNLTRESQIAFLNKFWRWSLRFSKDSHDQEIKTYSKIREHLKGCQKQITKVSARYRNLYTLGMRISEILQKHHEQETLCDLESLQKALDEKDKNGIYKLDFSLYAELLLEEWQDSIRDAEDAYTGIALNLRMLAEVIFKNKFQLINLGLFDLYDVFVKDKVDIFCKEKATGSGNIPYRVALNGLINASRRVHYELAVKLFFPDKKKLPGLGESKSFHVDYEEKCEKKGVELARIGLLTLRGDTLEFIHRSFAEYFLGEYLFLNIQEQNFYLQKLLLEEILLKKDYALIRKFFNGQLEKNPLTDIALTTHVKELIKRHIYSSILFQAVKEKHTAIIKFLIDELKGDKDTLKTIVLATDTNGYTVLQILAVQGDSKIFMYLLELARDHLGILKDLMLAPGRYGQTALHIAAREGNSETVESWLEFVRDQLEKGHPGILKDLVLATDKNGQTVLHIAAGQGDSKIAVGLLELARDQLEKDEPGILEKLVLATDERGHTALHIAATYEASETFENLLKFVRDQLDNAHPDILKDLVIATDKRGQTVLHILACQGYSKIVLYLLEFARDQFEIDHPATLKNLVLATDETGKTVLHSLTYQGDSKTVLYLLGFMRDHPIIDYPDFLKELVLATDENGRTVLHYAALYGRTKPVKVFLEFVRDHLENDHPGTLEKLVLATEKSKKTALHITVCDPFRENSKTVVVFFKFVRDQIENDHPGVLKKLVLATDEYDRTVLHYAALYGHTRDVKVFLKFVRDQLEKDHHGILKDLVLATDQHGLTALHIAAWQGHSKIVLYLLEFVRDQFEKVHHVILKKLVLATDENDRTVLHLAALSGRTEAVKVLLGFVRDRLERYHPGILKDLVLAIDKNGITAICPTLPRNIYVPLTTILNSFKFVH